MLSSYSETLLEDNKNLRSYIVRKDEETNHIIKDITNLSNQNIEFSRKENNQLRTDIDKLNNIISQIQSKNEYLEQIFNDKNHQISKNTELTEMISKELKKEKMKVQSMSEQKMINEPSLYEFQMNNIELEKANAEFKQKLEISKSKNEELQNKLKKVQNEKSQTLFEKQQIETTMFQNEIEFQKKIKDLQSSLNAAQREHEKLKLKVKDLNPNVRDNRPDDGHSLVSNHVQEMPNHFVSNHVQEMPNYYLSNHVQEMPNYYVSNFDKIFEKK